jgi:ABC-type multidrug transport system fused ATPase/permease subunit
LTAFPFDAQTAGDVLGAMITPAVLISASGTLTLSTTNRLARIVDRARVLHEEAEKLPPWDATDRDMLEKRALLADQIARQSQRIGMLQAAIITLYTAISLLVGASISIGLSAVAHGLWSWVPVVLGLFGAIALFIGAMILIREARMAVRSTLNELEYIKRMVARRTGAPLPQPDQKPQPGTPPESSM